MFSKCNKKVFSNVFGFKTPTFTVKGLVRVLTSIKTPYKRISTLYEKSVFPKKASSDVSRFILSCIITSDPNPTALSDVFRVFTTIVYLAIQVACFDA